MRAALSVLFAASLMLGACSKAESQTATAETPKAAPAAPMVETTEIPAAAPVKSIPVLDCKGVFEQGGAVLCQTLPDALIKVGGLDIRADQNGRAIVGFDRDAAANEELVIYANGDDAPLTSKTFEIAPREYNIQRIDGLPPSQVSTFTEAQLKQIRAATARKRVGFGSRAEEMGFRDGFDYPLKTFKKTSPFGAQRILNGEPKSPHYGVDIAAPKGTPIYAPADGIIALADADMYFEGQLVMVDHGQGLTSLYLHMSEIDVEAGQKVKRGDRLGAVGSTGRSTGPHLCWRLKWRNRNLDPELLTKWPASE